MLRDPSQATEGQIGLEPIGIAEGCGEKAAVSASDKKQSRFGYGVSQPGGKLADRADLPMPQTASDGIRRIFSERSHLWPLEQFRHVDQREQRGVLLQGPRPQLEARQD